MGGIEKSLQGFEIAQNGDGNLPASSRVRFLEAYAKVRLSVETMHATR
jgi:hypothetical protein